ncbi:hypothetical protein AZI86_16560 [Bdellovibrio bacteriovorus]|uniref:Alpha/beta hydrolase n=1 Tax=Bdellovibrio bacteriovorus TaxID=959 RepID=A0A150WH41_BDEBC|nr:hypothetical protein [Bdellovibrio bacteriovorus]KYG62444.1 hypothetical protein AZI86_16560 [Bdellovibrio bacteriovorus]
MKNLISFLMVTLLFSAVLAEAQVINRQVPVKETNPQILQMRGPHQVYWSKKKSKNILLISFGGTGSLPSDLKAYAEHAAGLGFDVVTMDYDNSVISTTCKDSKDLQCFDHFREEIATGDDVSSIVKVDKINSLESRILELLKFLAKSDAKRWAGYISNKGVNWNKVIFSGHSQGAGHAAYLAKLHPARGVVMLAGPQDRFADGRPVGWLALKSETPRAKYFSLLHEKDFFGSEYQVAAMKILVQPDKHEDHIIMRDDPVQDAHMSVISSRFAEPWTVLLMKAAR